MSWKKTNREIWSLYNDELKSWNAVYLIAAKIKSISWWYNTILSIQ